LAQAHEERGLPASENSYMAPEFAPMDATSIIETLLSLDEETASNIIIDVLQKRPELAPSIVTAACPDLTYAPARAITERRSKGIIKNFNPNSGYGFITCPELHPVFGSDVWVHKHQIGACSEGMEVQFAVMLSKELKPQAFDIQPVGHGKGDSWGSAPFGGASAPFGGASAAPMWIDDPWLGGKKGWGKGTDYNGGKVGSYDWGKGIDKGWGKSDVDKGWGKSDGKGKGGGKTKDVGHFQADRPEERELLGEFVGTVKSFNYKSMVGFGFIECEELKAQGHQNDVFVHHSEIGLCHVGDEVLFTAYLNSKGQPQAKDLQAPSARDDEHAAKRMRRA